MLINDINSNDLKIYLDIDGNTFFDLGWVLININQLLIYM